jgi:hypothetical protein
MLAYAGLSYLGPLMPSAREEAGDLDMKGKMLGQSKTFWTCLIVFGLVIQLAGCDLFDNPPRTLHMAAFKGNVKAARKFISDGISVNAKGQDGERPLHFAVYGNKIGMTKFLFDQGADVNGTNSSESTPLHAAAWKGHTAIAELLIDKGADVNVINKMGKTPLDWAIEQGHTEMATLIRKHGGVRLHTKPKVSVIDIIGGQEHVVSARIGEDGKFSNSATKDGRTQTISGHVSKSDDRYNVTVDYSSTQENVPGVRQISSTVNLREGESKTIGGIGTDVVSVKITN